MEFDNVGAVKRAVEINAEVAILPRTTVIREEAQGLLSVLSFSNQEYKRPLALIHRKGRVLTPAMKKLIDLLTSKDLNQLEAESKKRLGRTLAVQEGEPFIGALLTLPFNCNEAFLSFPHITYALLQPPCCPATAAHTQLPEGIELVQTLEGIEAYKLNNGLRVLLIPQRRAAGR